MDVYLLIFVSLFLHWTNLFVIQLGFHYIWIKTNIYGSKNNPHCNK